MTESARLAAQLDRALEGEAWHGPAWAELLEDVSCRRAASRPIESAHTIAEIVLHSITWHKIVRRRLLGETPRVSAAQDWPDDVPGDEAAWQALVQELLESGRTLSATVAAFPAKRLREPRPAMDETWYDLISGQLQHMLYHAGQVALLKKAGGTRRR